MKELVLKAYAKINLALDVIRKREDGYHDVKMIMQNIDLFDELTFSVDDEVNSNEASNTYKIELVSNKDSIPTDERNLVYKAIKMMFEQFDIKAEVKVNLIKNIPVEAGMAGGSTDCAAAIKAVNELFNLKLTIDEMMKIGVKLGADVPFCLLAKTALSEGIGEVLTEVAPLRNCFVLIAKPSVSVSTGMVYGNLKCDQLEHHPDIDGMIKALEKEDINGVSTCMENVLETVTVKLYPIIEEIKSIMKEKGAINAIMSGSGPTVFGIFEDREKAENAKKYIIDNNYSKEVYVTNPV